MDNYFKECELCGDLAHRDLLVPFYITTTINNNVNTTAVYVCEKCVDKLIEINGLTKENGLELARKCINQ